MTPRTETNPFPGYRPFDVADATRYFGREAEAEALAARLGDTRVLAVVGAPEVGKSSLVRAGVVPRLQQRGWRVAILRPGEDPIGNLARALGEPEALDRPAGELERLLRAGPGGLDQCVRSAGLAADHPLLVVVDQLDELIRYRRCRAVVGTAKDDESFVALVMNDLQRASGIRMLFTIRRDAVKACETSDPDLYALVHTLIERNAYELPAMTDEQLRRAVEGPVEAAGGSVAADLVNAVVKAFDPSRVPGQLPLVQHALMCAWNVREHERAPLNIGHYDKAGGIHGALFRHADEVCNKASHKDQELIDKVVRATSEYAGGHFVPRPATVAEIAEMCAADVADTLGVVELFQAPGRTFLKAPTTGTLGPATVVDVSYDSFTWLRRRRWTNSGAAFVSSSREDRPHVHGRGFLSAIPAALRRSWWMWATAAALAFVALLFLVLGSVSPRVEDQGLKGDRVDKGEQGDPGLVEERLTGLPACPGGALLEVADGRAECVPVPSCTSPFILDIKSEAGRIKFDCVQRPPGRLPGGMFAVVPWGTPWPTDPPPICTGGGLLEIADGRAECVSVPTCTSPRILDIRSEAGRVTFACVQPPTQRLPGRAAFVLLLWGTPWTPAPPPLCTGGGLVEVADGRAECVPAPTCPAPFIFDIRSEAGRIKFACVQPPTVPAPTCLAGQVLAAIDGSLGCKPDPPCQPGQILGGAFECLDRAVIDRPLDLRPCASGQVLTGVRNGQPLCESVETVSPLTVQCEPGQVLTGVKDGNAICQPFPSAPSIQFGDLPKAVPGFEYRLGRGRNPPIGELDLIITIGDQNHVLVESLRPDPGGKSGATMLDRPFVPGVEMEFPQRDLKPGEFGYTLTLWPDAGAWRAIIRRCAGKCEISRR